MASLNMRIKIMTTTTTTMVVSMPHTFRSPNINCHCKTPAIRKILQAKQLDLSAAKCAPEDCQTVHLDVFQWRATVVWNHHHRPRRKMISARFVLPSQCLLELSSCQELLENFWCRYQISLNSINFEEP